MGTPMQRLPIAAALLSLGLAGAAVAEDLDYSATHAAWKTHCVEMLAERHGASCLIEGLDETSGMALLLVTYPMNAKLNGELWLAMPDELRHEDLPGVLDVELQASDEDAPQELQGQPIALEGDRPTYLLMAHPDAVQDLVLNNAEAKVIVDLGGEAPLEGRFDLLSAAAAWRAVQLHQGWR